MNEHSVNIADAKKRFSELLGKVAFGKERITITKRGRPMALLVPAEQPEKHLSDVQGWLDEDDSFFKTVGSIMRNRKSHTPRILKENQEK